MHATEQKFAEKIAENAFIATINLKSNCIKCILLLQKIGFPNY